MSGYDVIEIPDHAPIKAWTRGVPIEDAALKQLKNVASLPFIHKHVAVMPDVHWGMGATVGSVIPTVGAIIPAAVGVDIGCGMMAVRTSIRAAHLPDDLSVIRSAIEAAVPHGRTDNGGRNDKGAWAAEPPASAVTRWADLKAGYDAVVERHPKAAHPRGFGHLGTLGTGNHFIELCLDEAGDVWVILHSGSRGVGNRFGTYFIERAKHEMRRWPPLVQRLSRPPPQRFFRRQYGALDIPYLGVDDVLRSERNLHAQPQPVIFSDAVRLVVEHSNIAPIQGLANNDPHPFNDVFVSLVA